MTRTSESRASRPAPLRRPQPATLARAGTVACLLAPAALMAALAWIGLGRHGAMGNDEAVTTWASSLPLGQLEHLLRHIDAVHGFYYLLIHFWRNVGSSPTVLRIPSALAMSAAAAVVAALARKLTGSSRAGLFAGVVVALTPSITYYAQTARSYALVFLCVAAATLVFLRAIEADGADCAPRLVRRRRWAAYAALIVVTGYLNELALLILAAHACTLLLTRARSRTIGAWFAAALTGAVPVLPLIILSQREDAVLNALRPPNGKSVLELFHDYFGGTTVAAIVVSLCALVGIVATARRHDSSVPRAATDVRGVSAAAVGVPLFVLPAAILMIVSLVARPLYIDRYVLFGEIGVALLAGAGLDVLGTALARSSVRGLTRPAALLVPGLVVCLLVGAVQIGNQRSIRQPASRDFNYGGPAHYIAAHSVTGDGLLFMNGYFRKDRLGYPKEFAKVTDLALAVPPQVTGNYWGRDRPFPQLRRLILACSRIWVLGRSPRHIAGLGPYAHKQAALLLARFRLVARRHWKRVGVTLWVRVPRTSRKSPLRRHHAAG